MTVTIDTRAAMRALTKSLGSFGRDQIPFATALALTSVAKQVAAAETSELSATFRSPTPFTQKAFGVKSARKDTLTASVFAKDRQALYLEPYAFGGRQVLFGKRAILTPADIALNQYHNLPRGKLKALKGRKDIFIGQVKTQRGSEISGVWRRTGPPSVGKRQRGVVRSKHHLQLLIIFTDPKQVNKHLPYGERAEAVVARALPKALDAAFARAIATAR